MDVADSDGEMEVTHYRGCVTAIQRDLNITSVRSSETWVPLKFFLNHYV